MTFSTAVEHQESLLWADFSVLPSWPVILQAVICIQNSNCNLMELYKLQSLVCGWSVWDRQVHHRQGAVKPSKTILHSCFLHPEQITDISKIVETFSIQGLHYCVCCGRVVQGPSSSPCFPMHASCDPRNCKGCHQAKGRPRCLERVCQKEWGYSCLLQLWPRSHWGAAQHLFRAEQGSFRTLRAGSNAAYPCMTGSWVCAKDYTVRYGNAPLLQRASYSVCKSCISAAHCKVEGHTKQLWWQCPPNNWCLLCPAGLWENTFWTETLRTVTVHNLLHSAHETPVVTCIQGMLSVPSWVENIWNKMLTCPHLFQKLNLIMETRKVKKGKNEIRKCLSDLLSHPLPLKEATVDFCSHNVELQFLSGVTQYSIPFQLRWLL